VLRKEGPGTIVGFDGRVLTGKDTRFKDLLEDTTVILRN
jgi:glycerol-3-phosphate O-acyltransferase / dihydroxyacetone phosphate acyltransferase